MHQREKHLRCPSCTKRMLSVPSLVIHASQMHNISLVAVPNAIPGRDKIDIDVLGMKGIPEEYYRNLETRKKASLESERLFHSCLTSESSIVRSSVFSLPLPQSNALLPAPSTGINYANSFPVSSHGFPLASASLLQSDAFTASGLKEIPNFPSRRAHLYPPFGSNHPPVFSYDHSYPQLSQFSQTPVFRNGTLVAPVPLKNNQHSRAYFSLSGSDSSHVEHPVSHVRPCLNVQHSVSSVSYDQSVSVDVPESDNHTNGRISTLTPTAEQPSAVKLVFMSVDVSSEELRAQFSFKIE